MFVSSLDSSCELSSQQLLQNIVHNGAPYQCMPQLSRLLLTHTHAHQHAALYSERLTWTSARSSATLSTEEEGALSRIWLPPLGHSCVVPKCLQTALLEVNVSTAISEHTACHVSVVPSCLLVGHTLCTRLDLLRPNLSTLVHTKQYRQKRLRRNFQKMKCGIRHLHSTYTSVPL